MKKKIIQIHNWKKPNAKQKQLDSVLAIQDQSTMHLKCIKILVQAATLHQISATHPVLLLDLQHQLMPYVAKHPTFFLETSAQASFNLMYVPAESCICPFRPISGSSPLQTAPHPVSACWTCLCTVPSLSDSLGWVSPPLAAAVSLHQDLRNGEQDYINASLFPI